MSAIQELLCEGCGRDGDTEHRAAVVAELRVQATFSWVEQRSVSAHSAINSYCMQYGNYRMRGALDTPT